MNDRLHSMPTPARVEGHPEGTAMQSTPRAWIQDPPLPYRPDENPPPRWFWIELGPRLRRRPRCDGEA